MIMHSIFHWLLGEKYDIPSVTKTIIALKEWLYLYLSKLD